MKVGRSILAYLPVNLATVIVAFGGLAVLTRILEPVEYGRYALAMVTMLFMHMALFTWLEACIARFQARAERDGDEATYLKTIYTYAALIGVFGVALFSAAVWWLPIDVALRNVLIAAIVTTGMQLSLNLGFEAHKAAHRIRRYSSVYASHQLLSFLLGILVIMLTPVREMGMFIGIGISVLVMGMIDLPFMMKKLRGGRVESARLKTYFSYGAPISISLVLAYALNSADMYLITAFMGEASAGTYSAGYNLANRGMEVLFIWIGMALTPIAVTAMEQDGQDASVDVMRDYGGLLLWIVVPAAVGLAMVAEPLGFILGEGVRDGAVQVIPFIAFSGLLNGLMTYYVHRAYMLSGETGTYAWLLVAPVALNIVMNLWLIPVHGLMGAVWATIISYALGLVLSFAVARRHYPLPLPLTALAQILMACALMVGVLLALPESVDALPDAAELAVKAIVGGVVYVFVCFATDTAGCRGFVRGLFQRTDAEAGPALEAAE